MEQNRSLKRIITVGLMSALVFVGTYIHITIPTPLGPTMFHLGNVMCILSGLLFGPLVGGLSAGIGSAIFDLMDPNFAAEFWITFILKFVYGVVVGWIAFGGGHYGEDRNRNIVAAVIGALSYTTIYTVNNFIMLHFVLGNPMAAVFPVLAVKAGVSLINAGIAVVCALIIKSAIGSRLDFFVKPNSAH